MTTPTPSATVAPTRWIHGPGSDLVLFLLTPVLILPAILGAQQLWSNAAINAFVLAVGALGHHLPGMLRAYGDRALFRRFRTRFVLSPLVLTTACIAFSMRGSSGMLVVAYAWGIWHGWMQTYGFLRIYDAKVGSVAATTARWDFAMCAAWFLGGVLFSDARLFYLQRMTVDFGVPMLDPETVPALRTACGMLLAALTLGYGIAAARQGRTGTPANPRKWLLLATSVGWWWYANVAVNDILLGLILFEIFHDVQYLAIVWLFNRARADRDTSAGGFTRFLFRRSPGLVALYIAMVFAYGGLGPLAEATLDSPRAIAIAKGIVTASALLHFYFDGFLWKVRESGTRDGLGIAATVGSPTSLVTRHGVKWVPLLAVIVALWAADRHDEGDALARAEALAAANPRAAEAHQELGTALGDIGRWQEAIAEFDRALALVPTHLAARTNLTTSCFEAGRAELAAGHAAAARPLLERAARELPGFSEHIVERGLQNWQERRLDDAMLDLRCAVVMAPDLPPAHLNLALACRDAGQLPAALRAAEAGAAMVPGDAKAQQLVAELRARIGR